MAFLDIEATIVARLQARLAAANNPARVLTAADIAVIDERQQIVPALYVIFEGYEPTQDIANIVQQVEQTWTVVAAVRNAFGQTSGEGVRAAAAPLMDITLAALCGWRPSAEFSAMALASGTGPNFGDGFGYFPLRFRTRTTVRGTP